MHPAYPLIVGLLCAGCLGSSDSPARAGLPSDASLHGCVRFVAGLPLTVGADNADIADSPRPAKGVVQIDPAYKHCLVRATDHASEPPSGFARSDYSRRQAYNSDNTRFIVYAFDGYWHLYDAQSLAWIRKLTGPASDAEPQWHPENPELLYYLPTVGVGMTVHELNVSTGSQRTVGDLAARLTARWPTANAAWTRSEGSPSADARYWAFLVDDARFQAVGMIVWDMQADQIVSFMDLTERPDHLSMSPSGQYVVVSWDTETAVFDRLLQNRRTLQLRTEHSDLAIGANGHDYYVSIDYASNEGWVFMTDLVTGERTNLIETYLNGSATAMHFSGKGYDRPGWVLVSTYAPFKQKEWLHDKLFVMELAANPRIVPIAHHHSVPTGYWAEPHASVSRDFTRALFSSNWGVDSETDIDAYLVRIRDDVLP